ncbi:cbb3-type cytochrome oxidase assembly protein CcoS [Brumimicrobium glaciale]|jgi:cbb3-type cytochrome oxidase maturation protein|uniref:Cbb3-type cytochrome oxidase assembly protein CcoS n=1 Tax=Brumimicrobium glaciale TaxID=200475 RepID=A0A4Q4KJS8_9FLAO|nr:cbb3-type cytochrome oxidase assembly protein CcoS [Brumimicrobium glaciale]RYM32049.1 cbb3-type cytochrome oxidase assembly protein CcoS [Brumimicrobium glaciale]
MEIMYVMLLVSLFLAVIFFISFIWANKSGQYDDDVTPGMRILYDDEEVVEEKPNNEKTKKEEWKK